MINNTIETKIDVLPRTFNDLSYLQYILNTQNISETIKNAIDISKIVLNQFAQGNQIIIENKYGQKKELTFTGLRIW